MEESYVVGAQGVSVALIVRLPSMRPSFPIPGFGSRKGPTAARLRPVRLAEAGLGCMATPAAEKVEGRGPGVSKRLGSKLYALAAHGCRSP